VPCSLSAHNTALESSKNKLKCRPYCSLPRLIQSLHKRCPQPYPRAVLAMYQRDENANVAAGSDAYLFKCSCQPRFSCVFKEIPPREFDAGTSLQVCIIAASTTCRPPLEFSSSYVCFTSRKFILYTYDACFQKIGRSRASLAGSRGLGNHRRLFRGLRPRTRFAKRST
jgi:hypothetical protein